MSGVNCVDFPLGWERSGVARVKLGMFLVVSGVIVVVLGEGKLYLPLYFLYIILLSLIISSKHFPFRQKSFLHRFSTAVYTAFPQVSNKLLTSFPQFFHNFTLNSTDFPQIFHKFCTVYTQFFHKFQYFPQVFHNNTITYTQVIHKLYTIIRTPLYNIQTVLSTIFCIIYQSSAQKSTKKERTEFLPLSLSL